MPNYELISFDTPLALAEAAAERWLTMIESRGWPGQNYLVALSGGRIAVDFFRAIVENAKRRKVSFAGVHFFWADERCVPPHDPESNFGLAEKWLFQPLAIPSEQIHRVRGELPPDEATREATMELRRLAPADPASQPVFDVIFLGMGEDGHIASLFPGTSVESFPRADVYYSVISTTKPPPQRITLTYAAIAAAREVWVLASGAGKTEALRASLSGTQTPLGNLLSLRTQTRILTDFGSRIAAR